MSRADQGPEQKTPLHLLIDKALQEETALDILGRHDGNHHAAAAEVHTKTGIRLAPNTLRNWAAAAKNGAQK